MKTEDHIPKCRCEDKETKEKINAKVRPNILFWNDAEWNTQISDRQERNFDEFIEGWKFRSGSKPEELAILEIGVNQDKALLKLMEKKLNWFSVENLKKAQ